MFITDIIEILLEDNETFYVKAYAEDCILKYNQTLYDPPEYGPALVDVFIPMSDISNYISETGLTIPMDYPIDACTEYLEAINYDLNWRILDYEY